MCVSTTSLIIVYQPEGCWGLWAVESPLLRSRATKVLPFTTWKWRKQPYKLHYTLSSVQCNPLTDWVVGGTRRTILQRSSSSLFCGGPLWEDLARAGVSTLWFCPSSISSADHDVAHPSRCPDGWFWRGCRGVWHARTMQVSVSWRKSFLLKFCIWGRLKILIIW